MSSTSISHATTFESFNLGVDLIIFEFQNSQIDRDEKKHLLSWNRREKTQWFYLNWYNFSALLTMNIKISKNDSLCIGVRIWSLLIE